MRREHLEETGRRVRLRRNIPALVDILARGLDGCRFSFFVISAAPREVIQSALEGIVPANHIFGTELEYDDSGEVRSIVRVPAGYGKVAVVEELEERLGITPDRTIYVGDGSSDVHVMLHVNNRGGFTRLPCLENRQLARIAKSTILSDDASSVMVPILETVLGWSADGIRSLFESHGLTLHDWEKARTDRVTVRGTASPAREAVA